MKFREPNFASKCSLMLDIVYYNDEYQSNLRLLLN